MARCKKTLKLLHKLLERLRHRRPAEGLGILHAEGGCVRCHKSLRAHPSKPFKDV